jgi:exonuclease III
MMTNETTTDTTSSTSGKEEEDYLRIILLNIMSGRNNRLEQAARSLQKMGADIGILTETKITDERYTRSAFGYDIICTQAPSSSCGGVAILIKQGCKNWHVEGTRPYRGNVINTVIVSGSDRWSLIGSYIAPSETNGETVAEISNAAKRNSHKVIMVGDLNIDLENV